MGRGHKNILIQNAESDIVIDKREVGFYKTPRFIAKYMTERVIEYTKGKRVLDPCCGMEDLIEVFLEKNYIVDGMDIIKYKKDYRCNYIQRDFFDFYKKKRKDTEYDILIANPPYNCNEVDYVKNKRKEFKELFADVGVHNTYAMFISAMIDIAKDNAIIGVICSDSFLTAKFYKNLREKIIETCSIHEITLCPKSLFKSEDADVKTCILILQKGRKHQGNILIRSRAYSIEKFKKELLERDGISCRLDSVILQDKRDNLEFVIDCPEKIKKLFNNKRIGDKYKCITGISTGNDKKYLSSKKVEGFTTPFYKNPGKDRFFTNKVLYIIDDYMRISEKEKNFIVRNKEYIAKGGITCSSMGVKFSACKLPSNSVFGVNPNIICSEDDAWWLLAYLNSSLVKYLVRGVLIRGNMVTSGYISRLPLIDFSQEIIVRLANLGKRAYENVRKSKAIEDEVREIDKLIYDYIALDINEINLIEEFRDNIVDMS